MQSRAVKARASWAVRLAGMADEVELTMVTMMFEATDVEGLMKVLSKYVVLSRGTTAAGTSTSQPR